MTQISPQRSQEPPTPQALDPTGPPGPDQLPAGGSPEANPENSPVGFTALIALHGPHLPDSGVPTELNALPGTLLGGPFAPHAAHPGLTPVPEDQLHFLHLEYLRSAYQQNPEVRRLLLRYARILRDSPGGLAVYALNDAVSQNVAAALRALASRLPPAPKGETP